MDLGAMLARRSNECRMTSLLQLSYSYQRRLYSVFTIVETTNTHLISELIDLFKALLGTALPYSGIDACWLGLVSTLNEAPNNFVIHLLPLRQTINRLGV